MAKSEGKAEAHEQEHDLYAAIGEFAVVFEQVFSAMEICVKFTLRKDGLKTDSLAQALLAGLTADPLLQRFRAIVTELRKNDPEDMRILKNISKRAEDLIEERNDVIHRTWFIGWGYPRDFSKAKSLKFKRTKHGVELEPREDTAERFESLSRQAKELSDIVMIVGLSLATDSPFSKLLKIEQDGTVRST